MDAAEPEPFDPVTLAGLLADPARQKVLAAVILGHTSPNDISAATGLTATAALKALGRLTRAGLVSDSGEIATSRLIATARSAPRAPEPIPGADELSDEDVDVLRHFVSDGRLVSIPVGKAKRRVVLNWLAARFEPGKIYPERDVNFILGLVHADYAALRRYLVDEEFLERRDGFYWRVGGTYDID